MCPLIDRSSRAEKLKRTRMPTDGYFGAFRLLMSSSDLRTELNSLSMFLASLSFLALGLLLKTRILLACPTCLLGTEKFVENVTTGKHLLQCDLGCRGKVRITF